jgi:hypothetical protein
MTMKNVITSPPLVGSSCGHFLRASNKRGAACVEELRKLFEMPDASKYFLVLSETEWADGDCVAVWILRHDVVFQWRTAHHSFLDFLSVAQEWLHKHLDMEPDTVRRYYLRLEYED